MIDRVSNTQVLIVGGGTAGCVAAIRAARMGMDTMIVEQMGCLGGTATNSLVMPLMQNGIKNNPENSGISKEINDNMVKAGYALKDNPSWFNPEMLKYILENMCLKENIKIKYHTTCFDVIKKNNAVKGIVAIDKKGLSIINADIIIDCTGDAKVAELSGVELEKGRITDGKNQPVSLRFELGNINMEEFVKFLHENGHINVNCDHIEIACVWGRGWPLEPIFKKALENNDIEYRDGQYFQAFSIPGKKGCLSFNCPEIFDVSDATDPDSITFAQIDGRRAILRLMLFMKKYFKGFDDCYIVNTASNVGIRESLRIKGEYCLSYKDYMNYAKFNDAIARTAYPIDIHSMGDDHLTLIDIPEGEFVEIPYRCLVPEGVDYLLVAGRCISASFEAQAAIRIQVTCRALGEAAGIAAALCIKNNITPREVDGTIVRNIMRKYGAFI